jgi:hypothetical protein
LPSFAFVATTPIVVCSAGRGLAPRAPERTSSRASAKPFPSSVRTPATTLPVAGSITSPTGFAATSAATTRPSGSVIAAVPIPDFIMRVGPPLLPRVAPAPAPTEPSATGPFVAASAAW